MTRTGSWSAEQPEGFHHIGLTDPDVAVRCRLFGEGWTRWGADGSGELIVGLTPPEALHGIRAWSTSTRRSRHADRVSC